MNLNTSCVRFIMESGASTSRRSPTRHQPHSNLITILKHLLTRSTISRYKTPLLRIEPEKCPASRSDPWALPLTYIYLQKHTEGARALRSAHGALGSPALQNGSRASAADATMAAWHKKVRARRIKAHDALPLLVWRVVHPAAHLD